MEIGPVTVELAKYASIQYFLNQQYLLAILVFGVWSNKCTFFWAAD